MTTILAGPILRRTTQNRICVWLALDSPQQLSLQIIEANKPENVLGVSRDDELAASHVQLGEKLFIYLLQAYPDQNQNQGLFPTNTLCHYRLLTDTSEIDLQAAKVTYGELKYPIFHIPAKLTSILHGSCRKPHGAHGQEALTVADSLLEQYHQEIGKRPDLLLLTGDQIYADDVEASLLDILRDQAPILTGRIEDLPTDEDKPGVCEKLSNLFGGKTQQPAWSPQPLVPQNIKLGGRAEVLKRHHSGLSSTEAGNHLLTFGEFAAMYIFVFGNAQGWQTATSWQDIAAKHIPVAADKQAEYEQATLAVVEFGNNLSKVRRLLANIPSYMIFDDHDVTDDWNITGHWYDKVRTSSLGRRMVSNALAAYWAFQGWGNDPDNFDADLVKAITAQLNQANPDPAIQERYDLMTWKHRGWGFSIATEPPIIAMDSRTQRQPENPYYPAHLLDRYALDWLRVEWSKLKSTAAEAGKDIAYPVLIAATPVMGFTPLERLVQFILTGVAYLEDIPAVRAVEVAFNQEGLVMDWAVDFLDAEAWTANLNGFTDFMDTLLHKMHIDKCVFLSGDVHYSFTTCGFYTSSNGYTGQQKKLSCLQLTSSSLRNIPSDEQKKVLNIIQQDTNPKTSISNWWRFYASQWRMEHTLLPCTANSQKVIETCNLGQLYFIDGQPSRHVLHVVGSEVVYLLPSLGSVPE